MKDAFWNLWDEFVAYVKAYIPTEVPYPKTWKGWAVVAVVVLVPVLWALDKIPDRKQIADVPRPVLTSEVSDLATKSEVSVNMKQMVMAFEHLQARVEALEAKAVKPKKR